jgi:hypothetical protein
MFETLHGQEAESTWRNGFGGRVEGFFRAGAADRFCAGYSDNLGLKYIPNY